MWCSASPANSRVDEGDTTGSFLDDPSDQQRGYESDKQDRTLADECGIELITPNRRNRSMTQTETKEVPPQETLEGRKTFARCTACGG